MSELKKITPNNQEFVLLSLDGYKKMANIDQSGKNLHWTTDCNTELPIKYRLHKINGKDSIVPRTIPQQLYENAKNYKDWPSLHEERKKGKWQFFTWAEGWDASYAFAKSLITFGVSHRSSVNIIGFNSKYWIWAFHGVILADCIVAGVYTTNTSQAGQYVAEDSSAELIVAEDLIQAKKYLEVLDQLPKLKGIVVWGVDKFEARPHQMIMSWNEFIELGKPESEEILDKRIEQQVPGRGCNIVYTSGTTGNPKGVMVTHDNFFFSIGQMLRNWEDEGIDDARERTVSYLPLSHSAAQTADIMSNLVARGQIYFARPDALQGSLVETLQSVRPTSFFAVPRVFEKMEEKMREIGSKIPSLLQNLSTWAKSKGTLASEAKMLKKDLPYGYWIANLLVLGRVKKALGLDQAKVLIVSAAPMKRATFEYFKSLDMPLVNVYGMSESGAPETTAKPGKFKEDTVGYAFEETDLKIDKRDKTEGGQDNEGEIGFRGRNNFIGYLNNDKATRETLDQDGYIHSGDLGTKDSDGFVKITGRIKELIITAGGENVAPVLIEDSLKSICPIISNVMVVGDYRNYLTALITLKVEMSKDMSKPTRELTESVKKFLKSELNIDASI